MMYNEFTERTGITPTLDEYYNVIEPLYMDYDGDKDKFCKDWKKMPQEMRQAIIKAVQDRHKTIHEYAECINRQGKELDKNAEEYNTLLDNFGKKEQEQVKKQRDKMLNLAIESFSLVTAEADAVMDNVLDNHYSNVFGKLVWIKAKHDKGLPLSPADIETLINNINL